MRDPEELKRSEEPTSLEPAITPSGDGAGPDSGLSGMIMPDGGAVGHGMYPELIPERIGEYRVLGQIGQGGMGLVLKATHDTAHGQRLVAIKLVRQGTGTEFEDVLSRFEVECRVLSALDHPNIARFYAAGCTESGQPYYVMEYIEGQPITAYCDANNLSVSSRIKVFRKVCDAVHYAHTNLVVHRDIKPENILVTPEGEPKLLDFGIAKLLNPNLAAVVAVTGPAMRLMTPEYASPEQVRGESISTMSDVYSLGVLLYELLSGHRPYRLASRLEHEIIRVICETDPERPSTAISRIEDVRQADGTTKEANPDRIAELRAVRPDSLRRQLSGDLDDIIMVAMTKSPSQRFASVQELADELGRHLRGEPVRVRRARRRIVYVARKFVKRHRASVGAAAAVLLMTTVLAGVTLRSVLIQRSLLLQKEAEVLAKEVAIEDKNEALRAALIQKEFTGGMWEIFGNRLLEANMSAADRALLWNAVQVKFEQIASRHDAESPDVLTELARAYTEVADGLGNTSVASIGQTEPAYQAYSKAASAYRKLVVLDPQNDMLKYRAGMVSIQLANTGRELNRSSAAMDAVSYARSLFESMDASGPFERRRRVGMMTVMQTQGQMVARECDVGRAVRYLESSLDIRRGLLEGVTDDRQLMANQHNVARGHTNLAQALILAERLEEAESHFSTAKALRQTILDRLGDRARPRDRKDLAVSTLMLGTVLQAQGRHAAARRELEEADRGAGSLVDADTSNVNYLGLYAQIKPSLAMALLENGELELAIGVAQSGIEACDTLDRFFPQNARNGEIRANTEAALGEALLASGEHDAAFAALRSAESIVQRLVAADPERVEFQRRLARVLVALGDLEKARNPGSDAAITESRALYRRADYVYRELESLGRLCGVPTKDRDDLAARLAE